MMIMMIMDHDDPGAGSVKPQLSRLQKIGVTYQEFALRWSLWFIVIIIITKLMIRYRYCVIIKLIIRDEEDEDIFEKLRPAADWIENALQVMIIMIWYDIIWYDYCHYYCHYDHDNENHNHLSMLREKQWSGGRSSAGQLLCRHKQVRPSENTKDVTNKSF